MSKRENEALLQRIKLRVDLTDRIRKAGGTFPKRWPWADQDDTVFNLQLLELAEALERRNKGARPLTGDAQHLRDQPPL